MVYRSPQGFAKKVIRWLTSALLIGAASYLTGCAGSPTSPVHESTEFQEQQIEQLRDIRKELTRIRLQQESFYTKNDPVFDPAEDLAVEALERHHRSMVERQTDQELSVDARERVLARVDELEQILDQLYSGELPENIQIQIDPESIAIDPPIELEREDDDE